MVTAVAAPTEYWVVMEIELKAVEALVEVSVVLVVGIPAEVVGLGATAVLLLCRGMFLGSLADSSTYPPARLPLPTWSGWAIVSRESSSTSRVVAEQPRIRLWCSFRRNILPSDTVVIT